MIVWILTEERPKKNVLRVILNRFCSDREIPLPSIELDLDIIPIFNNNQFQFTYEVMGYSSSAIGNIYIKTVSGPHSFVDFLIFCQDSEPSQQSTPIYAIEETKTSDQESRNTGAYQRGSKFVYIELFYPSCPKIMLYNYQIPTRAISTSTNIFGTRMLLTLEVDVIGRELSEEIFRPFRSLDELIEFKNSMRRPPRTNTPILINRFDTRITVSGRLDKPQSLHAICHDPNIGGLSLITKTIRKLGWEGEIEITQHNIHQDRLGRSNKFLLIANMLNVTLEGLTLPATTTLDDYWRYEDSSEKLGTVFLHLALERLANVECIYENHAGCERGYFKRSNGELAALPKRDSANEILRIPDLIICDHNQNEVLMIEGKKFNRLQNGLDELNDYDSIENEWILQEYPAYNVRRFVVLYGGTNNITTEPKLAFILSQNGDLFTSTHTPQIILDAINNIDPS